MCGHSGRNGINRGIDRRRRCVSSGPSATLRTLRNRLTKMKGIDSKKEEKKNQRGTKSQTILYLWKRLVIYDTHPQGVKMKIKHPNKFCSL